MSLLAHEPLVRLLCFGGVFAVLALWEVAAPRRNQAIGRAWRWPNNLGVVIVDTLVLRVLFPDRRGRHGALRRGARLGPAQRLSAAVLGGDAHRVVLVLDLAIYLQHVLFHAVPALWRLHRMHHADLEFDVTTGVRFHPVEILLSMLIKFAVVAALGAPALAVLIFEVLLNATSMFNHAQRPHAGVGSTASLRWIVVTPDMHRVHHSIERRKRTAISASTCLGGTACSAPIAPSPKPVTRA